MIYTNNVDNREYLFTDKFEHWSDKSAEVEKLELMDDFPRDTRLMWLLRNKYIVDSYRGKALDDEGARIKKLDSIIAQVEEIERVYGWGINSDNLIFSDLIDDIKSIKDKNYEPGRHQIDTEAYENEQYLLNKESESLKEILETDCYGCATMRHTCEHDK